MLGTSILLTFAVIWFIIFNFTEKITQPIEKLTGFTEELTQATDFKEKKKRILKLKDNAFFADCAK